MANHNQIPTVGLNTLVSRFKSKGEEVVLNQNINEKILISYTGYESKDQLVELKHKLNEPNPNENFYMRPPFLSILTYNNFCCVLKYCKTKGLQSRHHICNSKRKHYLDSPPPVMTKPPTTSSSTDDNLQHRRVPLPPATSM